MIGVVIVNECFVMIFICVKWLCLVCCIFVFCVDVFVREKIFMFVLVEIGGECVECVCVGIGKVVVG